MGRAPNKGMVGLSARYYDSNVALMNAHFAADLKGRNRAERRNQVWYFMMRLLVSSAVAVVAELLYALQDAHTTLRELTLRRDSEQFDVHTQHHYCTYGFGIWSHGSEIIFLIELPDLVRYLLALMQLSCWGT